MTERVNYRFSSDFSVSQCCIKDGDKSVVFSVMTNDVLLFAIDVTPVLSQLENSYKNNPFSIEALELENEVVTELERIKILIPC